MKKVVWLSDFDPKSSGYANISIPICDGLGKRGYNVKAIGLGYDNREHWFDFSIISARQMSEADGILKNLQLLWKPDVFIVALDITYQIQILKRLQNKENMKYLGIMPIESDPLCVSHAMSLMQMDKCFIISEFGKREAEKLGISAEHLQIGIDSNAWKVPLEEERKKLRNSYGFSDDTFVVLTVAANQERKNLSTGLEIFARFQEGKDAKYIIVTEEHTSVGWILRDLAQKLHISDKLIIVEKGITFSQLWSLYAMADLFFLPSKAEGLGIPILESFAVGVPVMGTNCTAINELLSDDRGFLVDSDYIYVDPFGNQNRYFINRDLGVETMNNIYYGQLDVASAVRKAREFVEKRTWQHTVDQIDSALQSML